MDDAQPLSPLAGLCVMVKEWRVHVGRPCPGPGGTRCPGSLREPSLERTASSWAVGCGGPLAARPRSEGEGGRFRSAVALEGPTPVGNPTAECSEWRDHRKGLMLLCGSARPRSVDSSSKEPGVPVPRGQPALPATAPRRATDKWTLGSSGLEVRGKGPPPAEAPGESTS
uniref:Uncharacterized protein n=1 Tax=Molossus molossus TaxID=27622 RepID=A0A7J8BKJ5_MOLMO|nr:hypothetical protein HJG59_010200 [Molossus molossus]